MTSVLPATCIVLNGTSGAGKSSIATALQDLWPAPLQVTGIDTFLASQSKKFFAMDGRYVDGFSWIPTTIDGQHAFDIVPGPIGLGMIEASHAFWAACAQAGLDQVIDDVWLVPAQPAGLQRALATANVLWVGVRCPLLVAEQREKARGDRPIGNARGQYGLVHSFRQYDLEVETSLASPAECAQTIMAELSARFGAPSSAQR
jgi:chloramphenicol 3-O phosphotransferase